MYKAQQAGADGAGEAADGAKTEQPEEDVVDAEFEEVDGDEKPA
jgi:hypothetical protein